MEHSVQVISKDIVKPSSQTPNHLKKSRFSCIDQVMPPVYVPFIFFYQADESKGLISSNHVQISRHLKQSLSDTLFSFYPLAGRAQDDYVIDCNDAGVEFIDARVHARIIDVIQEPIDIEELEHFLPMNPAASRFNQFRPLLLVQITFFDCGGFALGACFSHKIADCASAMAFFNAWAATCRGEANIPRFTFDAATFFPTNWIFSYSCFSKFFMSNEKRMTKRFVFDKEKLAFLKQAATAASSSLSDHESSTIINDPTRVELVSAFIWKHFIEMSKSKNLNKAKRFFGAFHVVNMRTRTNPPHLLANVFGNCIITAPAIISDQSQRVDEDFQDLINKIRSSIRRVREVVANPLHKMPHWKIFFNLSFLRIMAKVVEWCFFSSWCGFPVYEADYGWGKPIRFCPAPFPIHNLIILVSSRSGDDIEAIVTMNQDNLEKLEARINNSFPII